MGSSTDSFGFSTVGGSSAGDAFFSTVFLNFFSKKSEPFLSFLDFSTVFSADFSFFSSFSSFLDFSEKKINFFYIFFINF